MQLPSTGPISMAQVASELGIPVTGINLNDSRVRQLAGKPSGTISMADLLGKSGISNLEVSVTPSSLHDFDTVSGTGTRTYTFTANVTGGVSPYTYAWTTTTGAVVGATNTNTFQVRFSYTRNGAYYSGEVRLVLTDQQGTQRTVVVPVNIEFYGEGVIWN